MSPAKRVLPHLGRKQRLAVWTLFDQGYWQPGVPWGIGTDAATGKVMRSLVARDLADSDYTGLPGPDGSRYWLTMAGYAWLIADAAASLRGLGFGTDAAEALTQRISHLAQCARLVGVLGGNGHPVDWRGNPV